MWKNSCLNLVYYPGIYVAGLRKITKNSEYPESGPDLNGNILNTSQMSHRLSQLFRYICLKSYSSKAHWTTKQAFTVEWHTETVYRGTCACSSASYPTCTAAKCIQNSTSQPDTAVRDSYVVPENVTKCNDTFCWRGNNKRTLRVTTYVAFPDRNIKLFIKRICNLSPLRK
jgi:hypothetical protein